MTYSSSTLLMLDARNVPAKAPGNRPTNQLPDTYISPIVCAAFPPRIRYSLSMACQTTCIHNNQYLPRMVLCDITKTVSFDPRPEDREDICFLIYIGENLLCCISKIRSYGVFSLALRVYYGTREDVNEYWTICEILGRKIKQHA